MPDSARITAVRHRLADRLFHWVMAVSVLVLGATAFLPILGVKFGWLPWHWSFGVVLTAAVLFHLLRVIFVQGFGKMVPRGDDLREIGRDIRNAGHAGLSPAKYDAFQKLYHLAVAIVVLALIGTGLTMLAKIDTSFWRRNPAILSDQNWGVIYVLHGASAMALLFLFILHIYFNLLPEHRDKLVSMVVGRGPAEARKGTR